MILRRHRYRFILQFVLLQATFFLFLWLYFKGGYGGTCFLLIVACFFQLRSVYRSYNRPLEEVRNLISLVSNGEDLVQFSSVKEPSLQQVSKDLQKMTLSLSSIKKEKEGHYQFLNTLIHHLNVGIILITGSGKTEMCNKQARQMLGLKGSGDLRWDQVHEDHYLAKIFRLEDHRELLIKTDRGQSLTAGSAHFMMNNDRYKLITIQDIQDELENQELDSWQKLIRVLTHEIMNSLTPIISLSGSIDSMLNDGGLDACGEADVQQAVEAIHRRSQGLTEFVRRYRDVARPPIPDMRTLRVADLFERVSFLFQQEAADKNVELKTRCLPENLLITGDTLLLEQVLINLIKNSLSALSKTDRPGVIEVSGTFSENGKRFIQVRDNGPGVPPEYEDQVFLPFFTTERGGSGIGLYLCRQILKAHEGTIHLESSSDGTVISLCFYS